jgi:hypothetical protein
MKSGEDVCFGCGKEAAGTPAGADWIISGARRFRALLSLPEKHTVACSECLPALLEKRKKFERNLLWYRVAGGIFFLLAIGTAAYKNSLGIKALLGAAAGALLIVAFAFFYYSPIFGQNGRKSL